jgi:hypothetical protein
MAKTPAKKRRYRITDEGIKVLPFGARTTVTKKLPKKPRVSRRFSDARDAYYVPLGKRTKKGKERATRYERMSCSAGALAASGRPGYATTGPRQSCGPTTRRGAKRPVGIRDPRAHRLLALWRWCIQGKTDSCVKFFRRKNPGRMPDPTRVDLVYAENVGPGKNLLEWAAVQPHAGVVLKTGTAANPEAAAKAAQRVAADWTKNPDKYVRAVEKKIEEAIQAHEYEHHRPMMRAPKK